MVVINHMEFKVYMVLTRYLVTILIFRLKWKINLNDL